MILKQRPERIVADRDRGIIDWRHDDQGQTEGQMIRDGDRVIRDRDACIERERDRDR